MKKEIHPYLEKELIRLNQQLLDIQKAIDELDKNERKPTFDVTHDVPGHTHIKFNSNKKKRK